MDASAGLGPVEGASLAFPGPFEYENGISRMTHKLPYLFGVDLRQALAARFVWQPAQVRFLKDASAFLLGEIGAGAAKGVSRAVGITLGTGIGAAFAVDGRVVTEGKGVPPGGEIWDLPYQGGIAPVTSSAPAKTAKWPSWPRWPRRTQRQPTRSSSSATISAWLCAARWRSLLRRSLCWAAASRARRSSFFPPRKKSWMLWAPNCASLRSWTMQPWPERASSFSAIPLMRLCTRTQPQKSTPADGLKLIHD
jgi:hypothetical protein